MSDERYVYSFGGDDDHGMADKDLLGGKGANLAGMSQLGLPVPPGFTISTRACLRFHEEGEVIWDGLKAEIKEALSLLETRMGCSFGDADNPLLVSVRSGAAVSMPGMMDTVLNLGLNDTTVEGLASSTDNRRFALDSYRRFLQMYGDVVLEVERDHFEDRLEQLKDEAGVYDDNELESEDLQQLCQDFGELITSHCGASMQQDPLEQLWGAIGAVFLSWNNRRAIDYRKAQNIPDGLGTAVNVQAMVFGNKGDASATGVAFTRDPKTGEKRFFGEWLRNAQGEDVVAGIRTPQPINAASRMREGDETLESAMPGPYADLVAVYQKLETHYRDMQDIEFTIEDGKLWMLQTRTGKRTPRAEVRIAVDMADEGLIDRKEAVQRVSTEGLEKLLHPQLDPNAPRDIIARGLGASPGAATGKLVFTAEDAVEAANRGEAVVLVRRETSPEDIHGMLSAQGILTARGGMTSHAAVVARGISKPCIVGATELDIDTTQKILTVGPNQVREGDVITLDGGDGSVMRGDVPTIQPETRPEVDVLMGWVDEFRRLGVYANADTPRDCEVAVGFGAEGVGLCRTEHMFFDGERIRAVREMILAEDTEGRARALGKLLPMQRGDFEGLLEVMAGRPVVIRLLDPPLHEFLPQHDQEIDELARSMEVEPSLLAARTRTLEEVNPMLGHRGCRLGLTYPEIYRMQGRALMEAAIHVAAQGIPVVPKIMIPLVGHQQELARLRLEVQQELDAVRAEHGGAEIPVDIGTMIELPRACLTADEIAEHADFFSFGTNDLTQTTFGISRDDGGSFLPSYVEDGILDIDPFVALDPAVGKLVAMATELGRQTRAGLSVGICGEQGGEPRSVSFCHKAGLDYVSCSPFRVPVARLAAAHAALEADA